MRGATSSCSWNRKRSKPSCAFATLASALPRMSCRMYSHSSSKRIRHRSGRTGASVSDSPWCAAWSSATVVASPRQARAPDTEVSSPFAYQGPWGSLEIDTRAAYQCDIGRQMCALLASRDLFGEDPDREQEVREVHARWAQPRKAL